MFELPIIAATLGLYMAFLLFIALWVERKASLGKDVGNNPVVYSLSLAVYLSAWTFYGSVGKAASSGMLFLTIYLGPTIATLLWWTLLRKMVRIRNAYGVTSIADFISLRYDKSPSIAALVTVMSIVGIVPYCALQLKAITSTLRIISGAEAESVYLADIDIGLIIALFTIFFTIIIGVRRQVPTERHQGMVVAIAVASVVKLVAFLAVGFFVTFGLFDGFGDIFRRFSASPLSGSALGASGASFNINWLTYLVLSMSAIMFLPKQFHIAVVENFQERHIRTAMWLFPLYMLLITVFIMPIALGGLLTGYPVKDADIFVLKLPLASGQGLLSLAVFLGGFASASGMIMISSMALSTMFTNHLLLPFLELFRKLGFIKHYLLQCRWIAVAAFILAGYWFELKVGRYFSLVDTGMISFVAVLQFAPAILGGLYWKRGNKAGALLGLCSGFLLWLHTLILPAFARGGLIPQSVLENGPAGVELLRPEHLFGLNGLDPISHAVFWTMLCNIGLYVLTSLYVEQSQEEQILSEGFVNALAVAHVPVRLSVEATIDQAEKKWHIGELFNMYFPPAKAVELTLQCLTTLHIDKKDSISIVELAELHNETEKLLAGSIGAAAAHNAVHKSPLISPAEENALKQIYADIIAELRVTPTDLLEKINYHREKERLLTVQAAELAEKVRERDKEITERKRAEKALQKSERKFRAIFDQTFQFIGLVALDGTLIETNRTSLTFSNVSEKEVLGRPFWETPWWNHSPELQETLKDAIANAAGGEFVRFEATHRAGDGSLHYMDFSLKPVRDEEGNVVMLIPEGRDITERKRAEEGLAEKQRLLEQLNIYLEQRVAEAVLDSRKKDQMMILQGRQAAMGEMIGNIAHQWRQPLNMLGLILQELKMTYGRDEFSKESLETSVKKAMGLIMNMSHTIEDFSNYYKPERDKRLFNVNQAVMKTLSLVETSLKSLNIHIDVVEIDDTSINGYANEYSQVLLNVLINSRDAFEGRNIDRERVITITIFRENNRSVVTVADDAGGIPEDIIDKIFDPYFTTKGPDKGTGIGLYMAKTIIEKNMGGRLSVRNTADGAEFRIEV